jgi:hypothetical protein
VVHGPARLQNHRARCVPSADACLPDFSVASLISAFAVEERGSVLPIEREPVSFDLGAESDCVAVGFQREATSIPGSVGRGTWGQDRA